MTKPSYSLTEISTWGADGGEVCLPNVQRTFVWKAYQIENLWDSILRGFPVGAFVLAKDPAKPNGKPYELLDGQQRATAICLGFGNHTFRGAEETHRVFIDLVRPDKGDFRKYNFRVVTKSHPWGYRSKDNTKPLSSDDIRKAMTLYKIEDHLTHPIKDFFPYDAALPLPLDFFFSAESPKDVLTALKEWPHWGNIVQKHGDTNLTEAKQLELIKDILEAVKKAKGDKGGLRIPALYLDRKVFTGKALSRSNSANERKKSDDSYDDNENEEMDEVENLFVRLNSGGTPLRGEELNYSILKSHLTNELQKKIEGACDGLMDPARFISIAFRLFQNRPGSKPMTSRDAIQMRVRTKPFQRLVGENLAGFEAFLQVILDSKKYAKTSLLKHAKLLLTYNGTHSFGLPYPIVSALASKAPEVMFMLLYRLMHKRDDLTSGSEMHRKMLGVITLFLWFGKSDGQRDHSKLLASIWPSVRRLETEHFWSSSTVQRASLNGIFPDIPHWDQLSRLAKNIENLKSNSSLQAKIFTDAGGVTERAFSLRDLLLFAQRDFLAMNFKEEHFGRDDTNVPFDWDHISPHSLIIKRQGIPKPIKECYHTNGNLRAWPYSLNRMDQDDTPDKKLAPLNRVNFINSEESWKKYYSRVNKKYEQKKLSTDLQIWSFCDREWLQSNTKDLRDGATWKSVCQLIINRNINIYREWHEELRIDELTRFITQGDIARLIDRRQWGRNLKSYKAIFDPDYDYWVNQIPNKTSRIYIAHPKSSSKDRLSILGESAIQFGLFEDINSGLLSSIVFSEDESQYVKEFDELYCWVYGRFTLTSHDDASYRALFDDFNVWLKAATKLKISKELFERFKGALRRGTLLEQ